METSDIIIATVAFVVWIFVFRILFRNRDWIVTRLLCPPEILYFETSTERGRVAARALIAFGWRPVMWASAMFYVVLAVSLHYAFRGPTVAFALALPANATVKTIVGVALLMIPLLCPTPLLIWQLRRWMRGFLRDYLNEHGIPICRKCGYDLRGLASGPCPECGTPSKNTTQTK